MFVAGFIGSPGMSFAPAERLGLEPKDAIVGVRPEFARLWSDGLVGPFEGEVEYVEALGRETFLGVGGMVLLVDGRAAAEVGETVRYGLVREGLRYFDADSGRKLS